MSFLSDLKNEFETIVGLPVVPVVSENRFQSVTEESFEFIYGDDNGNLPPAPAVTYKDLYPRVYWFKGFSGNNPEDFRIHFEDIIKLSCDCLADSMNITITKDETIEVNETPGADDLINEAESVANYHSDSFICYRFENFHKDRRIGILKDRTQVNISAKLPFERYYLDSLVPFFNPVHCKLDKIIVYNKTESFVIADVNFEIINNRLKLSFKMGLNSQDRVKAFKMP